MKLLDWDDLTYCPTGTIFSFFHPAVVDGLHRIEEWRGESFYYSDLIGSPDTNNATIDPPLTAWTRCNEHDGDKAFLVYSEEDVQKMINALKTSENWLKINDDCDWSTISTE